MKQNINFKQWDSISNKQKFIFASVVYVEYERDENGIEQSRYLNPNHLPSIGEMIEFLDDEIYLNITRQKPHCWSVGRGDFNHAPNRKWNDDNELCDALWEAVKDKLSKQKV